VRELSALDGVGDPGQAEKNRRGHLIAMPKVAPRQRVEKGFSRSLALALPSEFADLQWHARLRLGPEPHELIACQQAYKACLEREFVEPLLR
jgi:hypothetical protein